MATESRNLLWSYEEEPRVVTHRRSNQMRIVIIGAAGQVGQELVSLMGVGYHVFPLTHQDLDICDHARVLEVLERIRPDAIINTAAFHRVDEAEDRQTLAFTVNALAVQNLAYACNVLNAVLVHFSTPYVFDGTATVPYSETDLPNPINVYGNSKLAGEYLVRSTCPRHFIIRTSALYGSLGTSGKGGNFVQTMLRLANANQSIRVVMDEFMSPTWTRDLACKTVELLNTHAYGIYHITNTGYCSWYEFSQRIFQLSGLHPNLQPTTTAEYATTARRPAFGVLDNYQLRGIGIRDLRPWSEALESYFATYPDLTSS